MNIVLLKNYDHYAIVNDDADFIVGSVHPLNGRQGPYRVTSDIGPLDRQTSEAGIVKSLDDAIPLFLAYCEKYPAPWERLTPDKHSRATLNTILRVEQAGQGDWLAYRDDYPLLRDGKPAHFATWADAEQAADIHELDLFPNVEAVEDGLSWLPDPELDWRSIPYLVEERADWQRSASNWLP